MVGAAHLNPGSLLLVVARCCCSSSGDVARRAMPIWLPFAVRRGPLGVPAVQVRDRQSALKAEKEQPRCRWSRRRLPRLRRRPVVTPAVTGTGSIGIGDALSYGWNAYWKNVGPMVAHRDRRDRDPASSFARSRSATDSTVCQMHHPAHRHSLVVDAHHPGLDPRGARRDQRRQARGRRRLQGRGLRTVHRRVDPLRPRLRASG